MKLIMDNNILFSLMKLNSASSRIFSILNCEFVAPSFILYEFRNHEEECLKKSGLTNKKFEIRKKETIHKIKFIDFEDYSEFIKDAIPGLQDEDDAPYIALALKLKIPIWSNDKQLKIQNKVTVLSTEDIINILFD
jgi:predicted nucleic acid-binding protein